MIKKKIVILDVSIFTSAYKHVNMIVVTRKSTGRYQCSVIVLFVLGISTSRYQFT